jgi:hypothetical protein
MALPEIAYKVEASNKTPSIDDCVRCDGCYGIQLILPNRNHSFLFLLAS